MPVLYLRVSEQVDTYVRQCQEESGLPLAKTVEVLLDAARRRGWRITGLRVEEVHGLDQP